MPDYEEIVAQGLPINVLFGNTKYEDIPHELLELYLTPDTTEQDIADAVSAHNTSNTAHTDIRNAIPTDTGDLTNNAGFQNATEVNTAIEGKIIDNVLSTSTTSALSANQGKVLQDEITHLQGIGRFLALWDATTGLAETNPPVSPYTYKTGDYFIVGVVGATNYKPSGSSYTTGVASSTVETATIEVGNVYYYDGTTWKLQAGGGGTITDVQVGGTSVVSSGVANIPYGTNATAGVAKAGSGLASMANGTFYIYPATDAAIGAKTNTANPIVPSNLEKAIMEGLGNYSGTAWTDAYKANARNTIGAQVAGDYQNVATIQTLSATDSITLADNTLFNGSEVASLTIALPSTAVLGFLCEIDFSSGTTATVMSYPNTIKWIGNDIASNVFTPVASKRYSILISYDGVEYVAVVKGI